MGHQHGPRYHPPGARGGKFRELNAELEQRVAERTAELEAANEDLKAFVYSVSHDLRTLLANVNGFARLLKDDYGGQIPSGARHYLELISAGTKYMEELIAGLLTLSRLSRQTLQKERVDTRTLVDEAIASLHQEARRPDLTMGIGALPDAFADRVLVKQTWINLLSNALKFTRQRNDVRIDIGAITAGDETASNVRDNGVGFDGQQADKLFGVFQRLHGEEEYPGTGVGLAIVQRIVWRHGGRVWAEAQVGQGAAFFFTLDPSAYPSTRHEG